MNAQLESRKKLHSHIQVVSGMQKIYYNPGPAFRLEYPCIVYHLTTSRDERADNGIYTFTDVYSVTVIDKKPDSELAFKLRADARFKMTSSFVTEGLYHQTFEITTTY